MIVFNIIPIWVSHSYTAFVVLKVSKMSFNFNYLYAHGFFLRF